MKKVTVISTIALVVLTALAVATPAVSQPPTPPSLAQLRQDAGGEVEITWNPLTDTPSFIRGRIPLAAIGLDSRAKPSAAAIALVDRYASLLGVKQASSELKVVQDETDALGMHHVSLQQVYQGVEVYGGSMKVHLSADGQEVVALSSGFVPDIQLPDVQPRITADQALAAARKALPNGVLLSGPKLVVYPGRSERPGASAKLAWLVELRDDAIPARNVYVIEAVTGTIIDVLSRLYNQADFPKAGVDSSRSSPMTSDQTEEAWIIYQDDKLGLTVQYPPNWHLYFHTIVGRHRGFDPLLLTSFEVTFEEYGRELAIPPGEAAILISFEDNDLKPGENLADYAWNNLASTEYRLTGKAQTFGSNIFIEMKGEIGTVWLTSKGSNVYSVYIFPGVDETQAETIQQIMGRLRFREQTNLIPEEDRGLKSPGQFLPIRPEALQTPAVPPLNMYMPWDDQDGRHHTYTGGPHDPNYPYWNCALREIPNMSALDFGMPQGTPVLAVAKGTVVLRDYVTGIGYRVGIDHGGNFSSEYWHLGSIHPSILPNRRIAQGTLIGYSGTAGSGPHLHLDFRTLPERTLYSAHGISIDRYTAWTYINNSDGRGFNYQGTLLSQSALESIYDYIACSASVRRWVTDPATNTIIAGDGQSVTSRNLNCPLGQYRADYYNNRDLSNEPTFKQCEAAPIAKDWGDYSPGRGISNDNFSVHWSGRFNFAQDTYSFLVESDDGIRLWIDGRLVIDAWRDQPPTDHTTILDLAAGEHLVEVEYYEHSGGATAHLHWWGHTTDSDDNRAIMSRQTLWGMIHPASDVDTYYFDAEPGQLVTIRMTRRIFQGLDPYLTLYGPGGSELARDDDSGGNRNALIDDFPIPQAGRYRIEAKSYEGSSEGLYQLYLQIKTPGQPSRETYDAHHGYTLPGTLARSEGQGPTGDQDIDNAHDFAGATYDYYWNTHGRDSYDNNGALLISTANYGRSYQNAYWNGEQVVYGDYFSVKDVVAHEWTHAVDEHSANLEYRWQSGALNESFSDIFAAMVDRDDWLMGEDLPPHILGGREAIRDLSNPRRFGQPDHTNDWVETCSDNEGVHTNSGITNKAYYNIATAIGKDKAERIFYRALTVYLRTNSSLEDARAAALQSAQDIYGANSAEYNAVREGFNAVGLDGQWNPPPNDCTCAATIALSDKAVYSDRVSALEVAAALYRVRDELLNGTAAGEHYRKLYEQHTGRISWLLLLNSELRATGGSILKAVTPGLNHLMDGQGDQDIITQELVDDVLSFLQRLAKEDRAKGGGELAGTIERERARIDWDRLVGMTYEEAWQYIQSRVAVHPFVIYLPMVLK